MIYVVPQTYKILTTPSATPASGYFSLWGTSDGLLHTKLPSGAVADFLNAAATRTANTLLAGPTTGSAAAPTFRVLVAADIPNIAQSQVTSLVSDLALKAPLASPTFTGSVTVPTPSAGTDATNKTYVDAGIAAAVVGLLDFKGNTDASGNPNYPSASKGDAYVVTVAGKVGGASGKSVDIGDMYVAKADNAGGTEASVGTSWFVLEHNLAGALLAGNNLSDVADKTAALDNLMPASIAKGDILVYNGSHAVRLPVAAAAGMALLSDPTTDTGLRWAFTEGSSPPPPPGAPEATYYWKFDEGTGSTSAHSGTAAGAILAYQVQSWTTTDLPPVAGGNSSAGISLAYGASGSTAVQFGANTSQGNIIFPSGIPISISGWFKVPSTPITTTRIFASVIGDEFGIFAEEDGIGVRVDGDTESLGAPTDYTINETTFFAVTFDRPVLKVYSGPLGGTLSLLRTKSDADVDIPTLTNFYCAHGLSLIDDYRIYHDQILTLEQLEAIFEGGNPGLDENLAPVITRPSNFSMTQDTTHTFVSDVSVADADAGSEPIRLSITCTNGTATLDGTTGLTFTSGDGTADATMVFSGTITNINNALSGMTFSPTAAYVGSASVVLVCNDLGNTGSGGAKEDTETITITVNAVLTPHSIVFDGSNDYLTTPSSSAYKPTSAITMSIWVKPTSTAMWRAAIALEYDTGAWDPPYQSWALLIGDLRGRLTTSGTLTDMTGSSATTSTWQNFTLTYDGSNVRLYKNNTLVQGPSAKSGSIDYGSGGRLAIGNSNVSSGGSILECFAGKIADIQIYSDAKTGSDLTYLATAANVGGAALSNLVERWMFTENTGTTTTGVNGTVATFLNGPTWDTDIPT